MAETLPAKINVAELIKGDSMPIDSQYISEVS
jgi:hypothetical protein